MAHYNLFPNLPEVNSPSFIKKRDKNRAKHRALYWRDVDRSRERQRNKRRADPTRHREQNMRSHNKRKYGFNPGDKEAMLAAQGGKCAICSSDTPKCRKGWRIDHCHLTKKVRAILCHHCNIALGMADDSPELLRKMADYLERFRGELIKV